MHHNIIIIHRRVINLNALDIEVLGVLRIQHTTGDVWNILPSITLTKYVNLVSLHGERVNEVLPEAHEIVRHINLVCDVFRSSTEACGDWLIDPDHVCKICPRIWVLNGLEGS